ncbi:MAG: hypothetical protein HN353_12535 [Bdellovibrionales bacterium]|jgi:hypothetical protein|nr:hypothetical protein [Bdellovibrionales bacterium]MBT3526343.1 hypothetical protein [Bdellovibrionales bacterium]MBT7668626.1 hypothetical protein [Bdellovibrionales bacterium]MBT7767546.1 hypothetical protein [Bdellovibrionales bacterium]
MILRGGSIFLMKLVFYALAVSSFIASSSSSAQGLLRIESETLSSGRNDEQLKFELPSYQFFNASYVTEQMQTQINSSFAVFADPIKHQDDFNVHLLDVTFSPLENLKVTLGRSLNSYKVKRFTSSDMLQLELETYEKRWKWGAIFGVEKDYATTEVRDSHNIRGIYSNYLTSSMFPLFVSAKFFQREDRLTAHNDPIIDYFNMGFYQSFQGTTAPEIMGEVESNLTTSHLDRATVGVDIHPDYNSLLHFEALMYDVQFDQREVDQPIFTIFSQGKLYELLVRGEYRINPYWSAGVIIAYDRYPLQIDDHTNGFRAGGEIHYRDAELSWDNELYYIYSYGGEVLGNRSLVTYNLSARTSAEASIDLSYYQKVTSAKRTAFNSQLGIKKRLNDQFNLDLFAEFNNNNIIIYDFRVLVKLTYLLWTEL